MLLFKLVLNLAFHFQILTKDTTPILPTQLVRTNSHKIPSELTALSHKFKYLQSSFNFLTEIFCLKKGTENFKLSHDSIQSLLPKSLNNILHHSAFLIVVFIDLIYAVSFF